MRKRDIVVSTVVVVVECVNAMMTRVEQQDDAIIRFFGITV
jgi:hypothetical protein